MIDHVWTVLCSRAVIDRRSNNASLENVLEQLTIREEPRPGTHVPMPMDVMTLWARSDLAAPTEGRGRLAFLSPSGATIGSSEYDIDLTEKYRRYRSVVHFRSLPLDQPGRYTFHVSLWNDAADLWEEVAVIPLEAIFEPAATAQAASEPDQEHLPSTPDCIA